jgi:hypothetical protein
MGFAIRSAYKTRFLLLYPSYELRAVSSLAPLPWRTTRLRSGRPLLLLLRRRAALLLARWSGTDGAMVCASTLHLWPLHLRLRLAHLWLRLLHLRLAPGRKAALLLSAARRGSPRRFGRVAAIDPRGFLPTHRRSGPLTIGRSLLLVLTLRHARLSATVLKVAFA